MVNPEFEIIDDDEEDADHINTGRIVPVYGLTEGLSQRQFRQHRPHNLDQCALRSD